METGADVQTAEQLQPGHTSETTETDGVARENAYLKAEIQRLQSDAQAELDTLDTMMLDLTSAQEELEDVKAQLAAERTECADLRANLQVKDELVQTKEAALQHMATQAAEQEAVQAAAQAQVAGAVVQSQAVVQVDQQQDDMVEELQKQVQFFKANSERLAKEIRNLREDNVRLNENLDVKQRELDSEKSQHYILKMHTGIAP